jgi:hypothetical protein
MTDSCNIHVVILPHQIQDIRIAPNSSPMPLLLGPPPHLPRPLSGLYRQLSFLGFHMGGVLRKFLTVAGFFQST